MAAKGSTEGAATRRQQALDLRVAGVGYRAIGKTLGVSYQTAYRDVSKALEELAVLQRGKAEKLQAIELERCEKMHLALWPKVRNGDEKAVRALVAVMDRRAKLLGLDAPSKIDLSAPKAFTLMIGHTNGNGNGNGH